MQGLFFLLFPHPLLSAFDLPAVERDGGEDVVHETGSVCSLVTDFSCLDVAACDARFASKTHL